MPKHRETKFLPYPPEDVFDLVADVARYPEFLPWCEGARVGKRTDTTLVADLIIGFKVFRERFTSKVTLERPAHIHVDYVRGPLKYLYNDWRFSVTEDGGTRIDFVVDFEFKSRILERLVGSLFSEAARRMVGAFEKRANQVLGPDRKKGGAKTRKLTEHEEAHV